MVGNRKLIIIVYTLTKMLKSFQNCVELTLSKLDREHNFYSGSAGTLLSLFLVNSVSPKQLAIPHFAICA